MNKTERARVMAAFHPFEDGSEEPSEIVINIYCADCYEEAPESPPKNFSFGWTTRGLQVWCNRHDVNVVHVLFDYKNTP